LFSQFHFLFKIVYFFRYLATGTTFTALHYDYRLEISTIRKIVLLVCIASWSTMKNEFFPEPTDKRWREISDAFRVCSHFPNCLGAINGKHIKVTKFPHSGSMNLNYKCNFSIVLMANDDSEYKFTYVDIETSFFRPLIRNKLHIPPSGPLFTNDTENCPFVFVGDEALSLSENLMQPYAGHNLMQPYAGHNLMQPYAGHNLSKNKEYSFTVYVGHEDP